MIPANEEEEHMKIRIEWSERVLESLNKRIEDVLFSRQEASSLHNSFFWGDLIFDAVAIGDEKKCRELLEQGIDLGGEPGMLAVDELRNKKNLIICYFSILTWEVIRRSCLNSEMAYSISDAGIQMIETAKTETEALQIAAAAAISFCRHIQAQSEAYHPLSVKAKEYIFKHFHEKIQISEMAKQLGVSITYLGQVFKKTEGLTISDYIAREKTERAKNLLRFSDYDLKMISHYLGFSSQSHFGEVFKKWVGMSPNEFRLKKNQQYREKI